MWTVLKYNLLFLAGMMMLGFTAAAQVKFETKLSRKEVGQNERFTVQFTVNAEGSGFQPPGFDDFRILGGPNKSTSMQIINFQKTVQNSYSYVLQPRKPGTFVIGSASVKVNGEKYSTEPVSIRVTRESSRARDPNDPHSKAARAAFFKVVTSKTKVYQGEPFTLSYKLYFKTDVGSPRILEEPEFTGFHRSNIEINRINTSSETYRGEQFTTGIVRQMVLIPQQTGTMNAGQVEMRIPTQIASNRRDFFGRMVGQTVNQTAVESVPEITVLPLPREGRPSGFAGAVGDYTMSVELSREEVSADESVTLRVRISGHGNIKLIDAPEPEIPNAFEVYDPKYNEDIRVSAGGMSGTKTYEYLLIPRYGGTYKIPELKIHFFNPNRKRYETLTSDEMQIKVSGAAPQPGDKTRAVASEKERVDFINKEILFIKTQPGDFQEKGKSFLESTTFYSAFGGAGVTFAGMIAFFLFSKKPEDQGKTRSKRAGKIARKHLSEAKKALKQKDEESFYIALSAALWGYSTDKLEIPQSQLSKDIIADKLREKGVDNESIQSLLETMNRAEMARFTSAQASTPAEDYDQTLRLLTKMEDQV